jgi:FkbM family methyltransferase
MMLESNIELNGLGNRARAYRIAIGDRTGEAKLFVARSDSASSLDFVHSEVRGHGIKQETQVEMVTLDELVFRKGFPVPGHVKIDTEGYEAPILAGGKELLMRSSPTLYLEIHSRDGKSDNEDEIRFALAPFDYRILKEQNHLLCLPECSCNGKGERH